MQKQSETFAARLAKLREASGLRVSELAKKIGISRQYLYQIEAGEKQPAWDKVCALADALGVNVSEFRGK